MKIINIKKGLITAVAGTLALTSCVKDLEQKPIDPNEKTGEVIYENAAGYNQVVAKIYGGLALTGQSGPAGNGDVGGIDEGASSYIRNLWNAQVLTTDEAICSWGDFGVPELNFMNFSAQNPFLEGLYYRLYHQIAMVNEFLNQSTDARLEGRGQADLKEDMKVLRAEARFLRAFAYWNAIDLFGNVPFVTEEDGIGPYMPEQKSRKEVFNWLIAEINDFEKDLNDAATAQYGRIDKGAAWMLKAKLYLNAEVYAGEAMYDEVIAETEKINAAYSFYTGDYKYMFYGDNNPWQNADVTSGFIFSIPADGNTMQTYGASTFLIFSSTGGGIDPAAVGVSGAWGGNRARPQLVDRFENGDMRGSVNGTDGMFFDSGAKEIEKPGLYTDGFGVMKFRNLNRDGSTPEMMDFASTDFPMFRLADSYLMYAEAVVRGGAGDVNKAVDYVNAIRTRAFGDNSANINSIDLDENFILEERGRELFWECSRRTDLIRFGKFTSSDYLWSWKGGAPAGSGVSANYKVFAIPAKDVGANTNIVQNPGY